MSDSEIPLDIAGHESREPPGDGPDLPDPLADDEDPEAPDDADEDEVEPVEVLVQLAEDGEIDPWDIDIVAVTDKFLDRLDDSDIRTSGRALFYASVLLRMKSDEMLHPTDDEADAAEEMDPWEQPTAEGGPIAGPDPVAALEDEMDRRLDRKRARGSPETLDELVRELREAERNNWWKEGREYDTSGSPQGYGRGTQELDYRTADEMRFDDEPTAADVTGTTHAENVDDIIAGVWAELLDHYEAGRDEVLFAEIVQSGGSRVETFLGLLFLSHRGQVVLQQDDLFGDLWIRDPNAGDAATEAVADD
jgi:segregation and condensation protein A